MSGVEKLMTDLRAEFTRNEVEWRSQNVSKNGDKALALAYIDARAVMNRLDDILGPLHWQDSYQETAKGRIVCTLSLRIEGEWISKSDGAGDTQVEAEKGAMSDAFKRAAVKWGIGRYLYDVETPWVPCESYEKNGKKHFSKFTADPWSFVKAKAAPKSEAPAKPEHTPEEIIANLEKALTVSVLSDTRALHEKDIALYKQQDKAAFDRIVAAGTARKAFLEAEFKKEADAIVRQSNERTKAEKMAEKVDNYMAYAAPVEQRDIGAVINDSIPF